jgi:hypothetical protein
LREKNMVEQKHVDATNFQKDNFTLITSLFFKADNKCQILLIYQF